ncbi:MAG: Gfo/Idh/MocA family oxidoreductase [Flavobacteriaceae bacterium]|nr:Gfo/Idh/MocA family oxidoreductase [Flavobacteriaceae bacterium]
MRSNRRDFIKKASLAGVGLSILPNMLQAQAEKRPMASRYMGSFAAPQLEKIRIALIGVGARGSGHTKQLATIEGTEIVAISDLYQDWATQSADAAKEIGKGQRHKNIKTYHSDENAWKRMLQEVKPDAVFISTPWELHAPMAIESMKQGAHAFVEVPMATTLEELWEMVNTSEATGKHCMMMENVNYGRDELLYLNMVRQGVIGELLHAEAAYIHELRWQMHEVERRTGSWRTYHYAKRNGNLYPTHGLGPVAQYMNLARTDDNFRRLTSFSSPGRGRNVFAKEEFGKDHKWNAMDFAGGDINTSIVKTNLGRTIMMQWDETSPRPYTRHNIIQGTEGILAGFPTRIAMDGGVKIGDQQLSKDHHYWVQGEQLQAVYEKYEHPMYKRLGALAKKMGGHGGMDFMMLYRIVECLQQGRPLDQNVYEGAFWSAITPLSEASVSQDGTPQDFPDFTRGEWKNTKPLDIII